MLCVDVQILVNFLQVSTIVTSFKVDWEEMMLAVIDAFGMSPHLVTSASTL